MVEREERLDEWESELKEEVSSLETDVPECGGDGDGEGGGETASERISFGMGPNKDCCAGVK